MSGKYARPHRPARSLHQNSVEMSLTEQPETVREQPRPPLCDAPRQGVRGAVGPGPPGERRRSRPSRAAALCTCLAPRRKSRPSLSLPRTANSPVGGSRHSSIHGTTAHDSRSASNPLCADADARRPTSREIAAAGSNRVACLRPRTKLGRQTLKQRDVRDAVRGSRAGIDALVAPPAGTHSAPSRRRVLIPSFRQLSPRCSTTLSVPCGSPALVKVP